MGGEYIAWARPQFPGQISGHNLHWDQIFHLG